MPIFASTPLTQLRHLRLNNTTIKDPKCFEALVNLESLDLDDAYVLASETWARWPFESRRKSSFTWNCPPGVPS